MHPKMVGFLLLLMFVVVSIFILRLGRTLDQALQPVQHNRVCIRDMQIFATRENITQTGCDDSGCRTFRIQRGSVEGPVLWLPHLLLTWFSCENNFHHFLSETLHPIAHALDAAGTTER